MRVEFSKAASKYISLQDKTSRKRIRESIDGLTEKPPKGDIKPLKGSPSSYRLRIGDWRIIFTYSDENTVLIEKIAPRGEAYKGGRI